MNDQNKLKELQMVDTPDGRGVARVFHTGLRSQDEEALLPIRLPPYGWRTVLVRRSDFGGVPMPL